MSCPFSISAGERSSVALIGCTILSEGGDIAANGPVRGIKILSRLAVAPHYPRVWGKESGEEHCPYKVVRRILWSVGVLVQEAL